MGQEIKASDFKATCLALIDEVAEHHRTFVITKYGRPLAQLVPTAPVQPLIGSVSFPDPDDDLLATDLGWHAAD